MAYWLMSKYVDSKYRIPGFVLQPLLNGWISLNHFIYEVGGLESKRDVAEETEEIAEQSSQLMSIHYDMPLALFENFLGGSMKYSMGLWERGAETLEEAQQAMLEDLCEKAEIKDGHTILDIGCGFGSFAAHALGAYPNSKVYALTLSKVQAAYIRAKQAEPGHTLHSDRFYLVEDDFNTVVFSRPFHRIVSIGLFEHVSNLALALEKVRNLMKPEGRCLLHYIVYFSPLERMTARRPMQDPFFVRNIFPGGRIWSAEELAKHRNHLRIENSRRLNGANYRRTVECWAANLHRNWHRIKAASGLDDQKLKTWDLYLRICVGVFKTGGGTYYGNAQYLLRPD